MRDGNKIIEGTTDEMYTVVSLPMRDGNKRTFQKWSSTSLVVSLPMRDGNEKRPLYSKSFCGLLAYL